MRCDTLRRVAKRVSAPAGSRQSWLVGTLTWKPFICKEAAIAMRGEAVGCGESDWRADRDDGMQGSAAVLRIAAFDVDGTLVAGQLGGRLPRMFCEAGLVPQQRYALLRDFLSALPVGGLEDPWVAEQTYGLLGAMLRGVSCDAVVGVARRLWDAQRDELFGFVRPLLNDLRDAGFTMMLISGGMHELLAFAAADLGIERFYGMQLERSGGVYTGCVCTSGAKHEIAQQFAGGQPIAWSHSCAAGDSLADAALLERVGYPYAFEPSPALRPRAGAGAWPIVDRRSLAPLMRAQLGVAPAAAREHQAPPRAPHAHDLRSSLVIAQRRLTDRVVAHVRASGAIAGNCESRVVESALMLTLLRRERMHPAAQDALAAYLLRRTPDAEIFDATMIDAALSNARVPDPAAVIEATLAGTDHAGLARKRLALQAVLAVVDAAPVTLPIPQETPEARVEVPWTQLLLQAVKVQHLAKCGSPQGCELEELIVMLEAGQRRGVWEKHLFVHLMALLALSIARPAHPAISVGVAHLAGYQNRDGGMPFVVDLEIFTTATGGLGLAATNADRQALDAMAQLLARHQNSNGGWSFARDVRQTDVDSTSYAVRFLHALDQLRYHDVIARARGYLRTMARPDGGFPTYVCGQPAEPAMTAGAMLALATAGVCDAPILQSSAAYLLQAQRSDGTFGRSWSLCESASICLSVLALRSVGNGQRSILERRIAGSIAAAQHRLLNTANEDGGWGQTPSHCSDPISTAYSLIALACPFGLRPQVQRAIRYLLSQQHAHGGYVSLPDQSGPRPLPYNVPVLADNFVLLAMTHLTAALGATATRRPLAPLALHAEEHR